MLTSADFITLPYTPDLTQAGVTYACRSLPYTFDRMGGSQGDRLRRIVGGVGVELAFRRYLSAHGVPYDVLGATPFMKSDRYDIAIGGRQCDLKSYLLYQKRRIRRVRHSPQILLDAQALVPVDQMLLDHMRPEDLYVFAFLTALITRTRDDLQRALGAGQPSFILHALPKRWSRPDRWESLGELALKCDTTCPLPIEIGGQDSSRGFLRLELALQPGVRTPAKAQFYTLAYLHTQRLPDGRVGVHSPRLDETYLIAPNKWSNIWVYGMEIILVGYITRGAFKRKAKRVPIGAQVFPYRQTRTENLGLPIRSLRPVSDLINRGVEWGRRRG